ncbi:MAG TPA: PcfJ domain-containing protein [Fimbriimonadaceae bacterium]|nr:PcfJ domain-containing protein [Fimbriimonadaceae bacterium]
MKALAAARKAERAADHGPTKRRTNDFLARYVALRLDGLRAIRPEEEYRARTYNRARQVLGLIDHVFVRYRVPLFLYRSVLTFEGLELVFGDTFDARQREAGRPSESRFRDWFQVVAQGSSFARVSRHVFTKKEAHWFLQAPDCFRIDQNILWAKAAAAGVPGEGCDYLVRRLDPEFLKELGHRLPDLIRFCTEEWAEMHPNDRGEIMDFIRFAVSEDSSFSLKGRTFGSLRKLSEGWHRTLYGGTLGVYRSWPVWLPAWEHRKKGDLIRAFELTNNRALIEEGRKQFHCVYAYASSCVQNVSRIASIRWYDAPADLMDPLVERTRLTVEVAVAQRSVVQVRGRQNRRPTDEETKIIRQWAGDHGLTIYPYAW